MMSIMVITYYYRHYHFLTQNMMSIHQSRLDKLALLPADSRLASTSNILQTMT